MMPACDGWASRARQRARDAVADIPAGHHMTGNRDFPAAAVVLEPAGSLAKAFNLAWLHDLVGRCVGARVA